LKRGKESIFSRSLLPGAAPDSEGEVKVARGKVEWGDQKGGGLVWRKRTEVRKRASGGASA